MPRESQTRREVGIHQLSVLGRPAGMARITAGVKDPINTAYDGNRNRLLLLQAGHNLVAVPEDDPGRLAGERMQRYNLTRLGLRKSPGDSC